jgi:hypothetical protein
MLVWIDVVVHERLQALLHFLGLRAEFKVHQSLLFAREERVPLFNRIGHIVA